MYVCNGQCSNSQELYFSFFSTIDQVGKDTFLFPVLILKDGYFSQASIFFRVQPLEFYVCFWSST